MTVTSDDQPSPLRGRDDECAALDQLVADARAGQGRVLVLRGEAGIGKTALLNHAARAASGCRVLRVAGVESEMELVFAGLHQVCAPMVERLDRLPVPQAEALGTAFGLHPGASPDRFIVGLAVLSLIADAAEEAPLICLVDDAQWLDHVSVQALAFVGRRLLAERVALVFAVREPNDQVELAALHDLEIGGLSDEDARALLESVLAVSVDAAVRDRIVAETRGNPLALLELPRGLTPAELGGGFEFPSTMPLIGRLEEGFLRQLQPLPPETHKLLLLAAVEPIGDSALLWRAASRLGLGPDDAVPAEQTDLIAIGTDVRFRHPVVRSAIYRAASEAGLREAHQALAEATDPVGDPDRRAWHLARAATEPDERIADQLERSADRAQSRGGAAAAASFLQRAAELSPDPAQRASRALAAAQAKFDAGAPDAGLQLLVVAERCPLDAAQTALLERLRAHFSVGSNLEVNSVTQSLVDTARRLEPVDIGLARAAHLTAVGVTMLAGRFAAEGSAQLATEAARAAPSASVPSATDLMLDGLTEWLHEGAALGIGPLTQALRAFASTAADDEECVQWSWLVPGIAPEVWDEDLWERVVARAVAAVRQRGALILLPISLIYQALVRIHHGQLDAATALLEEAGIIADATTGGTASLGLLIVAAWRGQEASATTMVADAIQIDAAGGNGRAVAFSEHGAAVLHNGLGHYAVAFAAAQRACAHDDLGYIGSALSELIEAAARCGEREVGLAALTRLSTTTRAAGSDWALGIESRGRALLSEPGDAEPLYREALDRLGRTHAVGELARGHLVYGEWLRREGRRVDARKQLRASYEIFTTMGAGGFAERARRELVATGEKVRKRSVETRDDLTPQEAQIARLAGSGQSNPEIAAELFLSPRTVEWHLRKVFTKLGISSRKELRRFASDALSA